MPNETIEQLKEATITEENAQEMAEAAKKAAIEQAETNQQLAQRLAQIAANTLGDHLTQLGLPDLNRDIIAAQLDDIPTLEDTKGVLDKLGIRYEEPGATPDPDAGKKSEGEPTETKVETKPAPKPGSSLADIVRIGSRLPNRSEAASSPTDKAAQVDKALTTMTQKDFDADPNIIHKLMIDLGAAEERAPTWS